MTELFEIGFEFSEILLEMPQETSGFLFRGSALEVIYMSRKNDLELFAGECEPIGGHTSNNPFLSSSFGFRPILESLR